MIYVGVDPGVTGGIAALSDAGLVVLADRMPTLDYGLLKVFRYLRDREETDGSTHALLERVHASPQMGVVSAFTFGRGYGALGMALSAVGIPYEEVGPGKWQQALGCRTKGDKRVSRAKAQQLFPSLEVTHAIADALLIAEYCRRTRGPAYAAR